MPSHSPPQIIKMNCLNERVCFIILYSLEVFEVHTQGRTQSLKVINREILTSGTFTILREPV